MKKTLLRIGICISSIVPLFYTAQFFDLNVTGAMMDDDSMIFSNYFFAAACFMLVQALLFAGIFYKHSRKQWMAPILCWVGVTVIALFLIGILSAEWYVVWYFWEG